MIHTEEALQCKTCGDLLYAPTDQDAADAADPDATGPLCDCCHDEAARDRHEDRLFEEYREQRLLGY